MQTRVRERFCSYYHNGVVAKAYVVEDFDEEKREWYTAQFVPERDRYSGDAVFESRDIAVAWSLDRSLIALEETVFNTVV